MITYSTNMMGPWSMDWYAARGLVKCVWKTVDSERLANMYRLDIGEKYLIHDITTYFAGGRIDVRGLNEEECYNGWDEYALPIMHGEDWNALSDWLDDFTSTEQVMYNELIALFEKDYGKKIRWANELFPVGRK